MLIKKMKKKTAFIAAVVILLFSLFFTKEGKNTKFPDLNHAARRIRTLPAVSSITEPWQDFVNRVILETFPTINRQDLNGIALSESSFSQVKQHGIVPSSIWISMVVRKLFPNFINDGDVLACALEIYNKFREYEIINLSDASGTQCITFRRLEKSPEIAEVIDPADITLEQLYLKEQRENPYDPRVYENLELLYQELLQKYPQRTYYYWQLAWIWGVTEKPEMRRAIFIDGAKKELSLLPSYIPRFPLAQIIQQKRSTFRITWGNYKNTDVESLEAHAMKYYLLFPEIFIPQGIPIEPNDEETFSRAFAEYKKRSENIIRAKQGIKFYVFARNGVYEPLYLAYKPDTQEVVGFRIEPSRLGGWDVAVDTFYKASGDMIEALETEKLIELLVDTATTDVVEQIAVQFDANQDGFRERRLSEQAEEFNHFGLTESMFAPAIKKIKEKILTDSQDKIGVIMVAGVSSAGKSPGVEIIQKELALQGKHTVILPMDHYFVNREQMPLIDGKHDFDNPLALDIERFQQDLMALLEGKEVDIPYYDFKSGESMTSSGYKIKLYPGDILIIDGIHALNTRLTGFLKNLKIGGEKIPQVRLFIDAPGNIRLARRAVRDWATRGKLPVDTIAQWSTVRRGEDLYIYPTMKYADVVINTDTGEGFFSSNLYSVFNAALQQALQDAETLEDTELIQKIRNLIEYYRISNVIEEPELPFPLP